MANINMDLETICNLRKRQQLFTMPSFRFTPVTPYPQYSQEELNMRRKAEILKYAGNRMNTKTNSLTKRERYTQIISGKYQSRPYTTTYTKEVSYVFDPILDMSNVVITTIPDEPRDILCPLDDMIPTPTSSSDVPGPIINLYNDSSIPLYNYLGVSSRIYAITDVNDPDKWKVTYMNNNVYGYYTITSDGTNLTTTEPTESTISSIYITNIIDDNRYTYELSIPIGIHFEGTYDGTDTPSLGAIDISIPEFGFNPQVIFVNNILQTNHVVSFHENPKNIRDISLNVINTNANFSGTIYIGMLKITNIELYTEPGYIYDINILTKMLTPIRNVSDSFLTNYTFSYGLYYNISESNKKIATNCIISTNASTEPYTSIYLTSASTTTA